jgi:hypothetical protein
VGPEIHLLTAGKRIYTEDDESEYFRKVRTFDMKDFYAEKEGGAIIESLRDDWKKSYDVVLVDSRTGVTDIGGVCTVQLPDILALFATTTQQSLRGVSEIARRVIAAHQRLPVERSTPAMIPIVSRFDTQQEFAESQEWLKRFASEFAEIYANWLPINAEQKDNETTKFNRRLELVTLTKIPYIPYFSFGENLPVLKQGTTDPSSLGYAYQTLAAIVAHNLESVDLLLNKRRDEFVRTAMEKSSSLVTGKSTVAIQEVVVDYPVSPSKQAGTVDIAEFTSRDKTVIYNTTVPDIQRLIDDVLSLLNSGATFVPSENTLTAEFSSKKVTFLPGSVQLLGQSRNEQAYLLSMIVTPQYQIWATQFIPLAARMDLKVRVSSEMPIA